MSKLPKPLNGNVLVEVKHDQVTEIYLDAADSKKDLQFAEVRAVSLPWLIPNLAGLIIEKQSNLKIGDLIIYNPRTLTKITISDSEVLGMLSEGNVIAIM